jgi:hypothetical protein
MIKKRTAIFFILLANIVLLAHAVIPHHHHNEQVCIASSHCSTDSGAHEHNTTEHKHEHDGNKNDDCCILKQIVVIPVNSLRPDFKYLGCSDNHLDFTDYQIVAYNNGIEIFIPVNIINAHIPLIPSSYTHLVNTSLGLRAPPIA